MNLARLAFAAVCLAPALAALAADFPTQSVTLVVPFAPGGPTDAMARTLAAAVELGQPMVAENRAGASGDFGAEAVGRTSKVEALKQPEVRQTFASQGLEFASSTTPEQLAGFIQSEVAKWRSVVQKTGAEID